jgi:hypothetical protein
MFSLYENLTTLSSGHAMTDLSILKAFNVQNDLSKSPIITTIIWQSSPLNWVKCNSIGASKCNTGLSTCGGIFKDNQTNDLNCFASNIGVSDPRSWH